MLPPCQPLPVFGNGDHLQGNRIVRQQQLVAPTRVSPGGYQLPEVQDYGTGTHATPPVVAQVPTSPGIAEAKVPVLFDTEPAVVMCVLVLAIRVLEAHPIAGEGDGAAGAFLDDDVGVVGPGYGIGPAVPEAIDEARVAERCCGREGGG